VKTCPPRIPAAEIDARVPTDSLLGLWLRLSVERHPSQSRALARAIHCESMRIGDIPRYGQPALRLVASRIASPHDFERLEDLAHAAYPPPSYITSYGCDRTLGSVSGRVVDAESDSLPNVRAMLAISGVTYTPRTNEAGQFTFEIVPTSSVDSLTLSVCAVGYDVATRKIVVREGSMELGDVPIRRKRDLDPSPGRGRETRPPDDCEKVAQRARP
jgi:hypothetical protein